MLNGVYLDSSGLCWFCSNERANFSHIASINPEYRLQILLFIANQDS